MIEKIDFIGNTSEHNFPLRILHALDRLTQKEILTNSLGQLIKKQVISQQYAEHAINEHCEVTTIVNAQIHETRCFLINVHDESQKKSLKCHWVIMTHDGDNCPALDIFEILTNTLKFKISSQLWSKDPQGVLDDLITDYQSQHALSDTEDASLFLEVRRRLKQYPDHIKKGFSWSVMFAMVSFFFSILTPAITFGGMLSVLTHEKISIVSTIFATAVGGGLFSLMGGQPMMILAMTGPIAILTGILYELANQFKIPFESFYVATAVLAGLMLMALSFKKLMRYILCFTRFIDEIFAALIAYIFIEYGLRSSLSGFFQPLSDQKVDLLVVVLALTTAILAVRLSSFASSAYLWRGIRQFFSSFGIIIAIIIGTSIAHYFHQIPLSHLIVPGHDQHLSSLIFWHDPLSIDSRIWLMAFIPALMLCILLFVNQTITSRLVNSPDNGLKHGPAYHLDFFALGLITLFCGMFCLPILVGSTVVSLNYVNTLTKKSIVNGFHINRVQENRLSGFVVHMLLGFSFYALKWIHLIPNAIIYGIFIAMGIRTISNNQFFERIKLLFMDVNCYPPTWYLKMIAPSIVHRYTLIQLSLFIMLVVIQRSQWGILFSVVVLALIPIRRRLSTTMDVHAISILDSNEAPKEEQECYL